MSISKDRLTLSDELMQEIYKSYKDEKNDTGIDLSTKKRIDISKSTNIKVNYTDEKTGERKSTVLNCKAIADKGLYFADRLVAKYGIFRDYLSKPIIWTFRAGTAYTNGIRIAVNPLFAQNLFLAGKALAKAKKKELLASMDNTDDIAESLNNITGSVFLFILVHECYHLIYQHHRRGAILYGTGTGTIKGKLTEHDVANIAMDLEINRDIEACYQEFINCTKYLDGIWYEDEKFINKDTNSPFSIETWETVYKYFIEHPDLLGNKSDQSKQTGNMKLNSQNLNLQNNLLDDASLSLEESRRASATFKGGWDCAKKAILNGLIDPAQYKN